jgi:excisionase family DNA binding protein
VDSEATGDYYTVDEAAKVLKLTPGRIRQMLRAGELEGDHDETGRWRIPAHAVHDRPRPPRIERPPLGLRQDETLPESPESLERLSDLEAEVRDLRYQLGLSEGRRELTEKAESTLRESLERERMRADEERERAERLQTELDNARRPWWRKLFGS